MHTDKLLSCIINNYKLFPNLCAITVKIPWIYMLKRLDNCEKIWSAGIKQVYIIYIRNKNQIPPPGVQQHKWKSDPSFTFI
jgi:hypothetical protein